MRLVRAQYNHYHLFRYSPSTLGRLVTECGFGVLEVARENSTFAIFAGMHPALAKGVMRRAILRAFFAAAALCMLQNKMVLTCRKQSGTPDP